MCLSFGEEEEGLGVLVCKGLVCLEDEEEEDV